MPVRRPLRARTMVLVGLGGVLAGVAMVVALLWVAGDGDVEVRLGDDEFRAGRVDALAAAIARDGPVAFPDLVGGERPIYVVHAGSDEGRGWAAVAAVAPGQDAGCVLEWDGAESRFDDPCGPATYQPDDTRLTTYPTRVEDRFLYVDLRGA